MSKQVYTVKNSKGQVIGARQSARAYTHALIINDMRVESYSSSEQGARRAISKFFQYTDEAFKAAHSTAVVPVECVGEVKPVTLTAEGCDLTVKTFHAYKYAVIDTATGKVFKAGKTDGGMFYTLEAAQAFQADHDGYTVRRLKNADGSAFTGYVRKGDEIETAHTYSLKVVSIIDPRDAVEPTVEPAPAPAVEPTVEIAALKAQVEELQAEIAALKAQLNPVDGFSAALEFIEDIKAQVEPAPAPAVEPAPAPAVEMKPININPRWSSTTRVKDPSIKRAVWLAGCAHNTPLHQAAVSVWDSEEQAYKKARCYRVDFVDGSAAYELRWKIMANQYPTGWYKQV